MQNKILVFLFIALIGGVFFSGCSSSIKVQNPVVGIICITGNEPFAVLSININDKDVYVLECAKEIKDELRKNQGSVYEITYDGIKETDGRITLIVKKAVKIKTK